MLLLAGAAMFAISSCSTGGSTVTPVTPTTPVSTFNITFNSKTYNLISSSTKPVTIVAQTINQSNGFGVVVSAGDLTKVSFKSVGHMYNLASAIGNYTTGYGVSTTPSYFTGSYIDIVDFGDGGKDYSGTMDSTSTINISVSNGTEVKGTFNINLLYNGTTYPATGDFDYKH